MMKKLSVLGSVLGVLVLTGAGCAMSSNTSVESTQTDIQAESTSSSGLPESEPMISGEVKANVSVQEPVKVKAVVKEVAIANFVFAPASITVKAGTAITWVNDDEAVHNIKSDNGSFPDSENLNTGSSYQFKFDKPGTYSYYCGLHPAMRGTIIVE